MKSPDKTRYLQSISQYWCKKDSTTLVTLILKDELSESILCICDDSILCMCDVI